MPNVPGPAGLSLSHLRSEPPVTGFSRPGLCPKGFASIPLGCRAGAAGKAAPGGWASTNTSTNSFS